MSKQSISLIIVPAIFVLSTTLANAHEVEVRTGNMDVSVRNGEVQINSNASKTKKPSWFNRLGNLGLFNNRSTSSSTGPNAKCDRTSSGYSNTRSNSSGTAVSRTSSSSTTMTCN